VTEHQKIFEHTIAVPRFGNYHGLQRPLQRITSAGAIIFWWRSVPQLRQNSAARASRLQPEAAGRNPLIIATVGSCHALRSAWIAGLPHCVTEISEATAQAFATLTSTTIRSPPSGAR
jgi:hypothetical protein